MAYTIIHSNHFDSENLKCAAILEKDITVYQPNKRMSWDIRLLHERLEFSNYSSLIFAISFAISSQKDSDPIVDFIILNIFILNYCNRI